MLQEVVDGGMEVGLVMQSLTAGTDGLAALRWAISPFSQMGLARALVVLECNTVLLLPIV